MSDVDPDYVIVTAGGRRSYSTRSSPRLSGWFWNGAGFVATNSDLTGRRGSALRPLPLKLVRAIDWRRAKSYFMNPLAP